MVYPFGGQTVNPILGGGLSQILERFAMANELIRELDGNVIHQRQSDGYLNATALCKAAGKLWADYRRLGSTEEFLQELSGSMGIPIDHLISQMTTGANELRGTWVHPDVAVHVAQWCSARFAVHVSKWVRELLATGRVELASIDSGDPLLDMLERTRQASEQTTLALAGIAETRRRQLALETSQSELRHLTEVAQRTATAALCQAESNFGYYAVLGYSRLYGREMTVADASHYGRELSGICRARGIKIGSVNDPRFGRVNTYPESLLKEYFGDEGATLSVTSA